MKTKKMRVLSALTAIAFAGVMSPNADAAGTNLDTHEATVQLWIKSWNTACSGVFVAPTIIVTAKHCVVTDRENPVTHQSEEQVEQDIPVFKSHASANGTPITTAEVLWYHSGSTRKNPDIAILRTAGYANWNYAPIANMPPFEGEKLEVCGVANRNNLWGPAAESYCGEATMTGTTNFPTDYILSKPLRTGNRDSGGPAYNAKGQVVGITHGDDYESNYSTPISNDLVRYHLSIHGAVFQ